MESTRPFGRLSSVRHLIGRSRSVPPRLFARCGSGHAAELCGARWGAKRAALRAHRDEEHAAELCGARWGAKRAALRAHRDGEDEKSTRLNCVARAGARSVRRCARTEMERISSARAERWAFAIRHRSSRCVVQSALTAPRVEPSASSAGSVPVDQQLPLAGRGFCVIGVLADQEGVRAAVDHPLAGFSAFPAAEI